MVVLRHLSPAALLLAAVAHGESAPKLRVACVGASITQGHGNRLSYPARLAKLLGDGYEVRNFGVSGRTLMASGDNPWIREHACAEALAYNPQIVTIDLGGNDSKPHNWAHKAEFKRDYTALIARFAALPSRPRILALTPVPAFPENYGIRDSVIVAELLPLLREAAQEAGVEVVDLHTPFVGLGRLFPDKVHPNDEGAAGIATVLQAALVMPVDPGNTALTPMTKLEDDSYDWFERHAAQVKLVQSGFQPEIVMIGDSITHFWGGEPKSQANAPEVWDELFAGRRVQNLGFGWDRTQNVLWRLDHGEFEGLRPRLAVLHIGTNNLTAGHVRENTPAEIAAGIRAIVCRLRARSPYTRIIVMGVMPRGTAATDPFRATIKAVNTLVAPLGQWPGITYIDLADKLLDADGTLPLAVAADGCHPTAEGYRRWAAVLRPLL